MEVRSRDLAWSALAQLAPEWEVLCRSLQEREPFYFPYWILAFSAFVPAASSVSVVTAHSQEGLAGILPLVRSSTCFGGVPARTLRSLSGAHSCRFDLACKEQARRPVCQAIWSALKADPSWDAIETLNVPASSSFGALQECARSDGFLVAAWPTLRMPYLELPEREADPFANSPRKYGEFRHRLGKSERKLARHGKLSFGVQTALTSDIFDEFLQLEVSGWKSHAGGAIAQSPQVRQFYQRALAGASHAGHLRMYSLRLNGKPIAMELGLLVGGCYYSPKAAYDEEFSQHSPGHLLTRFVITDLTRNGVRRYDFLGPRARHKYVWTDAVRNHAHLYIFRPTLRGRLAHSIVSGIAPRLRQAKYALYGDPQGRDTSPLHS